MFSIASQSISPFFLYISSGLRIAEFHGLYIGILFISFISFSFFLLYFFLLLCKNEPKIFLLTEFLLYGFESVYFGLLWVCIFVVELLTFVRCKHDYDFWSSLDLQLALIFQLVIIFDSIICRYFNTFNLLRISIPIALLFYLTF